MQKKVGNENIETNKQTNSGTYPGFGRLAQTDGRLTATSLIENELN